MASRVVGACDFGTGGTAVDCIGVECDCVGCATAELDSSAFNHFDTPTAGDSVYHVYRGDWFSLGTVFAVT